MRDEPAGIGYRLVTVESPHGPVSLARLCYTPCVRRCRCWSPTFPGLRLYGFELVRPSCLLTILIVASRFLCAADRLPTITVNDNRSPAGELRAGVFTISLDLAKGGGIPKARMVKLSGYTRSANGAGRWRIRARWFECRKVPKSTQSCTMHCPWRPRFMA